MRARVCVCVGGGVLVLASWVCVGVANCVLVRFKVYWGQFVCLSSAKFNASVYKVLFWCQWCLGHIPSLVPLPIRTAKSSLGEHG